MAEITTSGSDADLSFEVRWRKALEQPEVSIVDGKKIEIDVSPSAILGHLREIADVSHAKGELSKQALDSILACGDQLEDSFKRHGAGQAAGSPGLPEAAAAGGAAEVSVLTNRISRSWPQAPARDRRRRDPRRAGAGNPGRDRAPAGPGAGHVSASATISTTSPAPAPVAIIAAGLARGMPVAEIMSFYTDAGAQMFDPASLLTGCSYKFKSEPLAEKLKEVFGPRTLLGSDSLQSLLLWCCATPSTNSPWPISNNPFAKYNQVERDDCNLRLPLWQLVRASTAAPTYFPPEVFEVGQQQFVFVDGGVTMYNNPAFQLFLMATLGQYWPLAPEGRQGWPTGAGRMLLVSVGTGTSPGASENLTPGQMNLLFNATSVPAALMFAALNEQDLLCRVFGELSRGRCDRSGGRRSDRLLRTARSGQKLFTYVRYNADLSPEGLSALGCGHVAARQRAEARRGRCDPGVAPGGQGCSRGREARALQVVPGLAALLAAWPGPTAPRARPASCRRPSGPVPRPPPRCCGSAARTWRWSPAAPPRDRSPGGGRG